MTIHQEFDVISVNKNTKHLFEKFDQKFNIKQIDYTATIQSLYTTTFILAELLQLLMNAQKQNCTDQSDHNKNYLSHQIIIITVILSHNCTFRSSNNLIQMLELYFHSFDVKQHVLNMLSNLNICENYQTINRSHQIIMKQTEKNLFVLI